MARRFTRAPRITERGRVVDAMRTERVAGVLKVPPGRLRAMITG
jgi:hypothetical protein